MKAQYTVLSGLPAVIYGEKTDRALFYVHGKYGCKEEAGGIAALLCPAGYTVLAVDLPAKGDCLPWEICPVLDEIIASLRGECSFLALLGVSIGAYFTLLTASVSLADRLLLLSPVVDMVSLIGGMMEEAGIGEEELKEKRTVVSKNGDLLSYDYLIYAREHAEYALPPFVSVLTAENDPLAPPEKAKAFAEKYGAYRVQYPGGEHWFHTEEELRARDLWIRDSLSENGGVLLSFRASLDSLADPAYRVFQKKLMPDIPIERVVGVRTPEARKLAKALAKKPEEANIFLSSLPHATYDENNLHGFLLSECRDFDTAAALTDAFLPYVDNWATCDQTRPKAFEKNREKLIPHIDRWLASSHPFTVRFGIEMLMNFFLDGAYQDEYSARVAGVRSGEYYVNMMSAWYFATALAKHWNEVLPYLTERRLSPWVHNKTIRKAIESDRITPEQKEYLRTLTLK